jgi:hypothetical protein
VAESSSTAAIPQLLAEEGLYAELYHTQFADQADEAEELEEIEELSAVDDLS